MMAFLTSPWTARLMLVLAAAGAIWLAWHRIEALQAERTTLQLQHAEAVAAARASADQVHALQAQLAQEAALRRAADARLTQLQRESANRVAIFNQHRFGELVQTKPGLIEQRINAATARTWAQIEAESRGN